MPPVDAEAKMDPATSYRFIKKQTKGEKKKLFVPQLCPQCNNSMVIILMMDYAWGKK